MNCRPLLLSVALAATAGLAHAADVKNGATVFKKCTACHTATEAKNRVGPNLVNLIGRPVATAEGFKYSKAMTAFAAGKTWDEALLASYLAAPQKAVKGTTMAFAGLKKPTDIADVIAYLKDPAAAK
jgi:cytochrome c